MGTGRQVVRAARQAAVVCAVGNRKTVSRWCSERVTVRIQAREDERRCYGDGCYDTPESADAERFVVARAVSRQ